MSAIDVVIVGAGPSGLAAATALRRAGAGRVVVLDREAEAGGIPRHAQHQGFGLRDLRRSLSGPRYADHWTRAAEAGGAELRLSTQVTGWTPGGELELTSRAGRETLSARAIVLATGCRERPRTARFVAGTRPQGVMTTGMLQQLVYLAEEPAGSRAVVVGAEHVSFSALATLAHGGARPVAMTTEHPRHQSFAAFRVGAAARFRTPLKTRTVVSAIHGKPRVQAVDLRNLDTGEVQTVECDTVVFTADWIPDHELAVLGGVTLDPGTRGPAVDAGLHTTRTGVFAIGNLLHGAETADVASLTGTHVAAAVTEHLAGAAWPARRPAIVCEAPLHWITPNVADTGRPARGRHLLRAREALFNVRLEFAQDGHVLARPSVARLIPGRSARIAPDWTSQVDPRGGQVDVRVISARRGR